jgi:hypothetical protein
VFRFDGNQYSGTDIKEINRRTKLFSGEKEQPLQVIVNFGTFYLLTVPAERVPRSMRLLPNSRMPATEHRPRNPQYGDVCRVRLRKR